MSWYICIRLGASTTLICILLSYVRKILLFDMIVYRDWSITSTNRGATVTLKLEDMNSVDTGLYMPRVIAKTEDYYFEILAMRPLVDLRVFFGGECFLTIFNCWFYGLLDSLFITSSMCKHVLWKYGAHTKKKSRLFTPHEISWGWEWAIVWEKATIAAPLR